MKELNRNRKQMDVTSIGDLPKSHFNITTPVNNRLVKEFNINQWYTSTLLEKSLERALKQAIMRNTKSLQLKGSIVSVDAKEKRGGNMTFVKTSICLYLIEELAELKYLGLFEEMLVECKRFI